MSSIVIDNDVMCLFSTEDMKLANGDAYRLLFEWLRVEGILVVSKKMMTEYQDSFRGSPNLSGLIGLLIKEDRFMEISNADIKKVRFTKTEQKRFQSNQKDRPHIALVIVSPRKKMLSKDVKLCSDINGLRKINKIKPEAQDPPLPSFYL